MKETSTTKSVSNRACHSSPWLASGPFGVRPHPSQVQRKEGNKLETGITRMVPNHAPLDCLKNGAKPTLTDRC
ncbi:hypothetical protein Bca4012_032187 [Brassica carinata]